MRAIAFLLLLVAFQINLKSQNVIFTDYKPSYQLLKKNHIIDKIEYTEENIIIHFRVLASYVAGKYTIYGVNEANAWYLEDVMTAKEYDLLRVENIHVNGEFAQDLIQFQELERFYMDLGDFMTCEVYFPRLSNDVKKVNLIEGRGQHNNELHFNCLNIVLKAFDSPDLGTEKDMYERIQAFEEENLGEVITVAPVIIPSQKVEDIELPSYEGN